MLPLLIALALPCSQNLPEEDVHELLRGVSRITPEVMVVQAATPAVVYIETDAYAETRDFFGRLRRYRVNGSGTGVVTMKEGFVVTNYHVVKKAEKITVTFDWSERPFPAHLIAHVEQEDLALLKIDGAGPFPTVPLGTSSDLMAGEKVVAIGNPYGQTHTVSTGIISGLHRDVQIPSEGLSFDDLIQTDASINFGNSGGPLLNIHGELIGINSAMNVQAENIGFAIPVDHIKDVLKDQLLPQASRSWLGIETGSGDDLSISAVIAGGPAQAAGLLAGDRLVSLGGEAVADAEAYRMRALDLPPGQLVRLVFERRGQRRTAEFAPWDKQDGLLYERMGLTVESIGYGNRVYASVTRVLPDGPAAEVGLVIGDLLPVVKPVSGPMARSWRISGPEALVTLVANLEQGTDLELEVYRDLDENGRFERRERHRGLLGLR
ncbi:MAG TPA: trypsin-like peptidase domain-containing protein [Planctomycetota bacterium]|nr:trypsin-like peptidase domain-containing protein [Planctomycetota bacterium]